jgi:transcriptional regulator of acetoin/glycerol metabolism
VQQPSSSSAPRFTFDALSEVVAEHGGNMSEVAKAFGYSRTYFYKLLKASGIDANALRRHYRTSSARDSHT